MVDRKEVLEAKVVANEVLGLLENVKKELKSAQTWGLFDIIGGGFFSSLIKHDKIDRAEYEIRQVQSGLIRLQKELGDINVTLDAHLNISSFDRFLDIVFDNIFSDWMTQSKIRDSLKQVEQTIVEVQRVKATLEQIEREYC